MRQLIYIIRLTALLMMIFMLQACMTGVQLRTTATDRTLISGTSTLLLHGCNYPDQIDNVAILVDENSRYPLEIYDVDSSFKTRMGIPAQQAIAEADAFVRCGSHGVWQTRVTRISDDRGGTIGYEVTPLYDVREFGTPDVLLISYSLKNGKVRAYIRTIPQVEDRSGEGGDGHESGGH